MFTNINISKKLIFEIYEDKIYIKDYIQIIRIINMASKAKQVKAPTVYAFVLYGGVIKAGYTYVETSAQHPEAEQDGENLFDSYKKYFGNDLKGRYVKCQKPLEEITNGIADALSEHKYEESENLYKYNASDVVKVFKEVTGAKQCSTMGVYETTEEPEVKPTPAKKVAAKKAVSNTEDAEEAPKKVHLKR